MVFSIYVTGSLNEDYIGHAFYFSVCKGKR